MAKGYTVRWNQKEREGKILNKPWDNDAVIREKSPYRQLIYRPFWITVTGLLLILTLALAVLINSSWRALDRTAPLKEHLALIEEIQRYSAELDNLAPKFKTTPPEKWDRQLTRLSQALKNTLERSQILSDEARSALLHVVWSMHCRVLKWVLISQH